MNKSGNVYVEVVKASSVGDKHVLVEFNNGEKGIVDLTETLHGSLYDELVISNRLMDFVVDHDLGTLVWGNGLDVAPETLHAAATYNRDVFE